MMESAVGEIVRIGRAADRVACVRSSPPTPPRWEAFVERCPDATFFHRIGWRDIIEDVFDHRTPLPGRRAPGNDRGHPAAGGGRRADCSAMRWSRCRSASTADRPRPMPRPDAHSCEAASALVRFARRRASRISQSCRQACPSWPQQDLYVRFRKTLDADPEANLLAVPRKQRAMVRKGIRNGLRGEIDRSVDRFFALYADNVHRHGTPPFAKRYFARLVEVFGDSCEVSIVTDAGGRPVSGVMSFYFRDEVLPYYAGDTIDARDLAANDFKYWDLMRRACERGVRVFDYGRSKRGTGSFDFKKNWGFEPEPLHYEYRLRKGDADPAEQSAQSEVPRAGRDLEAAAASAGQRARAVIDPQSGIDMGDAAQWVRGLVGRRSDAAGERGQRARVGARGGTRRNAGRREPRRPSDRNIPMARNLAARAGAGGRPGGAWHPGALLADGRVDRCDLDTLGDVHARVRRRADMPLAGLAAPGDDRRHSRPALVARACAGVRRRRAVARHLRRRRSRRQAVRARVHAPGGHRHGARHPRCACRVLSARLPVVRRAVRRNLRARP